MLIFNGMRKLFNKINDKWLNFRKWSDNNIFGYLIGNIVKLVFTLAIFILIFYSLFIIGPFKDKTSSDSSINDSSTQDPNCNVAGINLHGSLVTYIPNHADNDTTFNYDTTSSEDVVGAITSANDNPNIKAIVIEVDSGGGSPTGGNEIAEAVKSSQKPVIAMIREVGASASYWAISGASKIFANMNSNVGSIGVTSSYLSNVQKNAKDGLVYEQLSVGKYKDSGSANKPLTQEERNLFMRDNLIIYQNFIEAVSINRNIPIEKVKSFSDGSTVLGQKAKDLGLIDTIGEIGEVEKYLEQTTGEKPDICWQ